MGRAKHIITTLILCLTITTLSAQIESTITYPQKEQSRFDRITSSKTFQTLEVPILLTSVGFAYSAFNGRFHSIRESYIPNFSHNYDDYTQHIPIFVMYGLKIGGVESRSSWGEMLTTNAFSIAITSGVITGLKRSITIRRPNGGGYNSFPSGHTATAFMTATMLHKEYGEQSRWYSIGAYSLAATTEVSRMLNNNHWMSDVLVGAAIGILSVELAYLFSDMIFKKKPKKIYHHFTPKIDLKPSFIGAYTGLINNLGSYTTSRGESMSIESGARVGIEGAWFMTPYLGVGGLFTATTSQINLHDGDLPSALNILSASGGLYLSYPLNPHWRVGTKALTGVNFHYKGSALPAYLGVKDRRVSLQSGASISYLANSNIAFKLFTDYSYLPRFIGEESMHEFTFGVSINLML